MATAFAPPPVAADPAPGKAVVLYDGDCGFCQWSVRLIRALDWFGRLHFQSARDVDHIPPADVPLDPKRLLDEMHVLTPDRRQAYAGYSAFRWMAWRLPLLAPFAALLYVPGMLWLGNRAYRWVARNRMNLVPCHNGACQIVPKRR